MKKLLCSILFLVMLVLGGVACSSSSGGNSQTQENTIQFTQEEFNLVVGESVQAEVVTSQKNVFIFWSMRDPAIAKIDARGMITAVSAGETVCYAEYGGRTAVCLVRVTRQAVTDEIAISVPYQNGNVSLYENGSIDLKPTVKMGSAFITDAEVTYTVADATIAGVENGVLTAKAAGATTVTITASYRGETASFVVSVQVYEKPASLA